MGSRLPRRAFLGVELAPAGGGAGVPVVRVLPGSMAAAAGLAPGDRLCAVGDVELATPGDAPAAARRIAEGAEARLAFSRAGAPLERVVAVVPLPGEAAAGCRVGYDEVAVAGGARLRTILTRPEGAGPHPGVLVIQGIECSSVDFWSDPGAPVARLVHGLARAGIATLRVDKSGAGDSEGPPCRELGFHAEVEAFRAGLAALAAYRFVDPARRFVFGHSVGGMIAPLLAAGAPLRGVAVYGTSSRRWSACMLASLGRQRDLRGGGGATPAQYDALYRAIFVDRLDPEEAVRRDPALAGCGDQTYGRTVEYLRQLEAADLAGAWRRVDAAVLAIHGANDWIVGEDESREIATLAGGAARFLSLPGADHLFGRDDSPFDDRIVAEIARWILG